METKRQQGNFEFPQRKKNLWWYDLKMNAAKETYRAEMYDTILLKYRNSIKIHESAKEETIAVG